MRVRHHTGSGLSRRHRCDGVRPGRPRLQGRMGRGLLHLDVAARQHRLEPALQHRRAVRAARPRCDRAQGLHHLPDRAPQCRSLDQGHAGAPRVADDAAALDASRTRYCGRPEARGRQGRFLLADLGAWVRGRAGAALATQGRATSRRDTMSDTAIAEAPAELDQPVPPVPEAAAELDKAAASETAAAAPAAPAPPAANGRTPLEIEYPIGSTRQRVLDVFLDGDADQAMAALIAAMPPGASRNTIESAVRREGEIGRLLRAAPG